MLGLAGERGDRSPESCTVMNAVAPEHHRAVSYGQYLEHGCGVDMVLFRTESSSFDAERLERPVAL